MALSIYDTPEGTLQPPPTATKEQGGNVSYCNITFFCCFLLSFAWSLWILKHLSIFCFPILFLFLSDSNKAGKLPDTRTNVKWHRLHKHTQNNESLIDDGLSNSSCPDMIWFCNNFFYHFFFNLLSPSGSTLLSSFLSSTIHLAPPQSHFPSFLLCPVCHFMPG